MPIRFYCPRCRQMLGIANRKAGTEIECPLCGLPQIVPSEEAAAAALALIRGEQPGRSDMAAPPIAAEESDTAAPIELPRRARAAEPVLAPPRQADSPDREGEIMPAGMILFPRWVIYVQALLFLVMALGGFAGGYFIGRGDAAVEQVEARREAAKERVLVEGRLTYNPKAGEVAGDAEAVVIALPVHLLPEKGVPVDGLRPQDPPPTENWRGARLIRELGGVYARTDATGHFAMVLPDVGEYYFLLISAHAARPNGEEIGEIDLADMEPYFSTAEILINRYKYQWETREIDSGVVHVEHHFGADRQ